MVQDPAYGVDTVLDARDFEEADPRESVRDLVRDRKGLSVWTGKRLTAV